MNLNEINNMLGLIEAKVDSLAGSVLYFSANILGDIDLTKTQLSYLLQN